MKEVGEDCLLKGLATLLPGSIGETVGTVGVYEDAAVTAAHRGAPGQDRVQIQRM